jgi:hypothetical protein
MPRVSYKYNFSEDDKAIAKENGLSISTVYARLRSGWDKQRAITEQPAKNSFSKLPRDSNGELFTLDPKGKTRSYQLPIRIEPEFESAIAASGISASDWIAQAVSEKLEAQKKASKGRKG